MRTGTSQRRAREELRRNFRLLRKSHEERRRLVAQLVHVVRMRQAPHVSGATGRADFQLQGMIDHIVRFSAAGVRACVGAEKRR